MSLATVAAVVGIGAGINSLTGGSLTGGSGSGGSATYVPTGLGQADTTFQQFLQSLGKNVGSESSTVQPGLQSGYAATQPGGQFGNLGSMLANFAQLLGQGGQTAQQNAGALTGAGNQVFQTALDPQNQLRSQLQQQVTDASRAGTSARGIGMSPEAAGIENQDVSNFLINWQNQQLQRQLSGLQGMGGAYNAAATQGSQAGQDFAGSSGLYNTASLLPFQYANAFTGSQQPINQGFGQILSQIIPYLNSGQGATGQAFQQQQTGLNSLTSGLGQLGKIFSSNPSGVPSGTEFIGSLGYNPQPEG